MARKSNFDSKPVVSTGSASTSSSKKTKRTVTRSAAHRKASSPEVEPAPRADLAVTENPRVLVSSESISNLSQAVAPAFDRDEVARLAYSYWEMRGGQYGSAEEDWLRAERELMNRG